MITYIADVNFWRSTQLKLAMTNLTLAEKSVLCNEVAKAAIGSAQQRQLLWPAGNWPAVISRSVGTRPDLVRSRDQFFFDVVAINKETIFYDGSFKPNSAPLLQQPNILDSPEKISFEQKSFFLSFFMVYIWINWKLENWAVFETKDIAKKLTHKNPATRFIWCPESSEADWEHSFTFDSVACSEQL